MHSACLSFNAPAPVFNAPARAAAPVMETIDDLKAVATKLNPAVGYWDPLKLAEVRRQHADQQFAASPCPPARATRPH